MNRNAQSNAQFKAQSKAQATATPLCRLPAVLSLAVLCAAMAGPAVAQASRGNGAPAVTGAISSPPAGTREWSGESGASGNPQMTAEEISAAAADFPHCLESLWPAAARRHISRSTFVMQTAALTPDLRIMDLLDSQPEFTKSFWDYLDVLVTDARIAKGKELLEKYRTTFDAVERAYGVDRYVLTAIWGVETNYGTIAGERPVLRSTATLACVGRRQKYFREEFLSALEIVQRGDVSADRLLGSWAGAFGPTQFMPTAFKKFAVDFDGDGRRDVIDSVPDMLASTANNLLKDGWLTGRPWGYEVVVPATFNFLLADRGRVMTIGDWLRQGIARPNGLRFPRLDERAYLLVPAGVQGPGFLMLQNFRVIMKYNPAEAYALAIGHLADRLRGVGSFVQDWPRYERVLTRSERLELQQLLAQRGFDVGEPDGQLGGMTRAAIREFQGKVGQVPDGFASSVVLDRLRKP